MEGGEALSILDIVPVIVCWLEVMNGLVGG